MNFVLDGAVRSKKRRTRKGPLTIKFQNTDDGTRSDATKTSAPIAEEPKRSDLDHVSINMNFL